MAKKSSTKKGGRLTAEDMAGQQREISVSEFFSKNRHLLGFDNPKRALLTTIKEAVDNSLDACEEAGILPEVKVRIEQRDGRDDRFQVNVEDNGPGIVKEQVGKIFGKLLYGSKFHRLKMSRGQQGIGISAAGMYGQLTTGKPVVIISKTTNDGLAHYMEVVMDTKTNEPKISKEDTVQWNGHAGTAVKIELEGHYQRGKWSPDEYLRQTAMANPHVELQYTDPDGKVMKWERATDVMPEEPRAIKPHPHGIELGMLIQMLHETKSSKLQTCLRNDFSRVSQRNALEICEKAGVYENARPKRIARQEAENLLQAIRDTKLRRPPLDCIAPIGEEQILAGLKNNVKADFYESVTRPPEVYRGNPFLVEVGIAYGGDLPAERSARLMRFANRVPLLYRSGACVMTQSVQKLNWKQYKVDQPTGSMPVAPMLILVHVASPWVPFTSESKEAVASYPEIEKEITLAIQEVGRKLRIHLNKRRRYREEKRKRRYIEQYIPHIGEALQGILQLKEEDKEKVIQRLETTLENTRKT
jgi:DNA topoisomerase-6 subunit B